MITEVTSGININLLCEFLLHIRLEKEAAYKEKKDPGPQVWTPARQLCHSLVEQAWVAHVTYLGLTHKTKELVCVSSKGHFHSKFCDSNISKHLQSMILMDPFICF